MILQGHGPKKRSPARRAASRSSAAGRSELAERLADTFDTRVRVELGRRKGKIIVEFASADDLDRIVAVMAPAATSAAPTRRRAGRSARATRSY